MNDDPEIELTLENLGDAAARLPGEWQLDAEVGDVVAEPFEPPIPGPRPKLRLMESTEQESATPPTPERILEAMLFVGGVPLTPASACAAIRNFTPGQFQHAVDALNRKYRVQRRPYHIQPREGGFTLAILPAYRGLRERLFGGPRETRLSQPALDVLSVIAYQQPIAKREIDAASGSDSGSLLRQLVRLGLVSMLQKLDGQELRYTTTPRLLTIFGLRTLDDLPRLGEAEAL